MVEEQQNPDGLDEVVNAYIEALLWATNDDSLPDGGEPMNVNYSREDMSEQAMVSIHKDCRNFLNTSGVAEMVKDDFRRAGHDFFLTRHGHGAGFWDGDWPEGDGEYLTEVSKNALETYPYIGDDGLVYIQS